MRIRRFQLLNIRLSRRHRNRHHSLQTCPFLDLSSLCLLQFLTLRICKIRSGVTQCTPYCTVTLLNTGSPIRTISMVSPVIGLSKVLSVLTVRGPSNQQGSIVVLLIIVYNRTSLSRTRGPKYHPGPTPYFSRVDQSSMSWATLRGRFYHARGTPQGRLILWIQQQRTSTDIAGCPRN